MIVVADTSVLLNLCCIGRGELLRSLFQEVVVPEAVAAEFDRLAGQSTRFARLSLPSWIQLREPNSIPQLLQASGLDPGETSALALALEIRADALLIDERRGHEVAVQAGLKTIGVLGNLLQAKAAGLIPEVRPLLDQLELTAGCWVSPNVRQRVLALAGE